MVGDRNRILKWHRCEAKYLINEFQAAQIRRYCRDHLPPDPFAESCAELTYPIVSFYLDSPSRLLLKHTIAKLPNRYKLRIRTYQERGAVSKGVPEYLEIKRKTGGVVHKTRAQLRAQDGDQLLRGEYDLLTSDLDYDRATVDNVHEFLELRRQIRAEPVVGVSYTREAYEGDSAERIRITLDRDLHYGVLGKPEDGGRDMWWSINPGGVILEVKFTNVYPFWVLDMLRRIEVVRSGVCKYVICSQGAGIMPPGA